MKVSVITPSYNRANLLKNAYMSLKKQVNKNFEWIIVDDGSKDNTKTEVENFIKENDIDIKYYFKENGGKHTAVNVGVQRANGELIIILDSDDTLMFDAIDTIIKDWAIYSNQNNICGMSYNKKVMNKKIEIKEIPGGKIISNHIEFRYNKNYLNDRAEVYRTDVMKKYPFIEIEGEKFLSEAVVWNKIAYDYDTVYIDKDIYECEYLDGGLTSNSIKTRVNNPKGAIANYEIMMKRPFKFSLRVKYSILYNTFSKFASIPFKDRLKKGNKLLIIVTKLAGDIVYMRWKKYLV